MSSKSTIISPEIRQVDGVFRLTVPALGLPGPTWNADLRSNGYDVTDQAAMILNAPEFTVTDPGPIEIAILPDTFCEMEALTMDHILAEGLRRNWQRPRPDVSCHIRVFVTNPLMEQMRLCYLAVMHEPINDRFLESSWRDGGKLTYFGVKENPKTSRQWGRNRGYVFVVPPTVAT